MYETELASVYDAFYQGRGKDYTAEADQVTALIRERRPAATSLLDVACGTGSHLLPFTKLFDDVAGLELSEAMLDVARDRVTGAVLHQGDMRDFGLGRTFDAVTCMFSSIGHMVSTAELDAAVARFAAHVEPGGVIVVEPWWFPGTFLDGYVAGDVVTVDGRTIARVSHSSRDGGASAVEVHYVVADRSGAHSFVDRHRITLFERAEYEAAFTKAGCDVTYLEGGPSGRGLFAGVRR